MKKWLKRLFCFHCWHTYHTIPHYTVGEYYAIFEWCCKCGKKKIRHHSILLPEYLH